MGGYFWIRYTEIAKEKEEPALVRTVIVDKHPLLWELDYNKELFPNKTVLVMDWKELSPGLAEYVMGEWRKEMENKDVQ